MSLPDPDHATTKPTVTYNFFRTLCNLLATSLFGLKVRGVEHVPKTGGALIVSNHQSYLDPALIGVRIYRPLSYLAKSELFENPIFGGIIRRCNAFPVRQGAGDVGAMRESIRLLKAGHVLNVFPEGSRTPDGKLQPIQPGVALLVRKAGVPVIPAIITGSYQAWRRGQAIPKLRPVRVRFGPAIDMTGLDSRGVVARIAETFAAMEAEASREG